MIDNKEDSNNTEASKSVMAQALVAFGQGAGAYRVSRDACLVLINHYEPMITTELIESWDEVGVQALERLRAIGRTAAHKATVEGRTAIHSKDVSTSISSVESASSTSICSDDWQ